LIWGRHADVPLGRIKEIWAGAAYDLNPQPTDIKPRILSTTINEDDNTASLALALEVAGYFDLDDSNAREIAKQAGKAVSKWRDEAAQHGLTKNEIDRMASAFEHADLEMAQSWQ
jgi:serine/threonine-protein kinase HipA